MILTKGGTTPLCVQDSRGFIADSLVKVVFQPHDLFFRIMDMDHSQNSIQVHLSLDPGRPLSGNPRAQNTPLMS